MLVQLLLIPILTAVVTGFVSARRVQAVAFVGTLAALLWSLNLASNFNFAQGAAFQFETRAEWVPQLGLTFSLGIDAVSLVLILLTTFLMPLVVLASASSVMHRRHEYYNWLLVLQTAMMGVFAARDLILFYTCFEFTLLPMYFLIARYGGTNRARASIVFFLYTFTGSIITLAGLVFVAWFNWRLTGAWTFDIAALTSAAASMSPSQQGWVLLALLCGFAVKVPLFPVHTWLPLAHTEAPTAGSVILAAVLLKLGTYGLFRFALPMCPEAMLAWSPAIAILCIIGIIYGALICWVQRDMKRLIAYSSVSHLGFCVLGLVALNHVGISGSVAYMVNHGLSTGALFLCIGMIYERYHTRSLDELGGLARRLPIWTFFMVFFIMSSVGLPGLNGFIGEFLSLVGTFASGQDSPTLGSQAGALGPWYAAAAGTGMILAAIYLLYLAGRLLFGPLRLPDPSLVAHGHASHEPLPRDLNAREILTLAPIAIACVVLGIRPNLLLDAIDGPVQSTAAIFLDSNDLAATDGLIEEVLP